MLHNMTQDHEATVAIQALTRYFGEKKYTFVCPSPETQGRVVQKRSSHASTADAKSIQDFFGWSLPCSEHVMNLYSLRLITTNRIQGNTQGDNPRRHI
jgi:hypothetical protein